MEKETVGGLIYCKKKVGNLEYYKIEIPENYNLFDTLKECSEEEYQKYDNTDHTEIDQFIAQTEEEIIKKRNMDEYQININFKPVKTLSNIELELIQSKRDNPYYSVEDEFGEDNGEFDRILQEDYEENKEFYEELARKYGNV
eukprot:gene9111-1201_t